jgi:hypothetical protein
MQDIIYAGARCHHMPSGRSFSLRPPAAWCAVDRHAGCTAARRERIVSSDDLDLRVLQHIGSTFRDQIRQADQKASIVMAFIAGLFTLNRDALGPTRDAMLSWMNIRAALAALLFSMLFVSMAAAFWTIVPRIDKSVASILFWQNWRSDAALAEIETRIGDPAFVRCELIRDIRLLARVIHRKLFWLRVALVALYVALVVFGVLVSARAFDFGAVAASVPLR